MTGYAKVEGHNKFVRLTIEIKSVNSRHLDLNFRMPLQYNAFEREAQQCIAKALSRGRVDVFVNRQALSPEAQKLKINEVVFKQYWEAIQTTFYKISSKKAELNADFSNFILNKEGIIISDADEAVLEAERKLMLELMQSAVDSLINVRVAEGEKLLINIKKHLQELRNCLAFILKAKKSIIESLYDNLINKLKALFDEIDFSSERVEQEAALRIERSDITEELNRIESHLQVLDSEINFISGKKLEFFAQELNREFNTISPKSLSSDIQQKVVAAKLEIEKIREQSMNLA